MTRLSLLQIPVSGIENIVEERNSLQTCLITFVEGPDPAL